MKITGKTTQLCVIGDPISHSFSPQIHNFITEYMGLDYTYSAYLVKPEELKDAVAGMRAFNIRGMNVTAPHKIEVMKYIDNISPEAAVLGSVNTVVNDNGTLWGYNTDCDGFIMSLLNAGITVNGKNILVMGCGGVVMPTLIGLIKEKPAGITLLNRTKSKAEGYAETIYKSTDFKIDTELATSDFDIVINTTTAGMASQKDVLPWDNIEELKDIDFINKNTSAVDMIYNPPCTKFLEYAKKKGAKTLNGLDMLIYQAIIAYEHFTDVKLPQDIADRIRGEVFGL